MIRMTLFQWSALSILVVIFLWELIRWLPRRAVAKPTNVPDAHLVGRWRGHR